MPDAFFATSKKRKRSSSTKTPPNKVPKSTKTARLRTNGPTKVASKKKDEELASGDSDNAIDDEDLRADDIDPAESGDEDLTETAAEKRLRLAQLYLESVKNSFVEGEFDAADLDRDIISSRLKQDVLHQAGKVHLFIADKIQPIHTPLKRLITRGHRLTVTSATLTEDCHSLFTTSKDGSIIQWDIHTGKKIRVLPKKIPPKKESRKGKQRAHQADIEGHSDEIWSLSLSSDGKYLASGGKDRIVGIWNVKDGAWIKGFRGHKDSISDLSFRKGSNQLYSASHDRTVKLFDLSVMGYVETLFGHQDRISGVDSLYGETAITSGSRDKTVRFWKIVEETQLVFRGGVKSILREVLEGALDADADMDIEEEAKRRRTSQKFVEGSMECVAMIDETLFLSGGDSGSISLWSTQKKKPIFSQQLAHGVAEHHSETEGIVSIPRWITALASLRYSDLFASGSWDGRIRLWRLDPGLKSFHPIEASIGIEGIVNSLQLLSVPDQSLEQASWMRSEDDSESAVTRNIGSDKIGAVVVAAIGQEPRTGRWMRLGDGVKNCGLVVPLCIGS